MDLGRLKMFAIRGEGHRGVGEFRWIEGLQSEDERLSMRRCDKREEHGTARHAIVSYRISSIIGGEGVQLTCIWDPA